MDELDIFKEQWKKEEQHLPHLKFEEIYKMILKRSSSAVKWIFIISILELVFGLAVTAFWHPSFEQDLEIPPVAEWISWAVFPLGIYFIYRFFSNYRLINTTSSVNELLTNIMKARRTVRLWIIINLVIAGVGAMIMMLSALIDQKGGWDAFTAEASLTDYFIIFGLSAGLTLFIVTVTLAIYFLLYGLLMRRLNRNYKELKKMEL
ncbi:hypothetical protein [Robertkochia sediminum]|uniref:hypothetical protein n=1 Tax=Robertkochia sediminum TaxID=2785326 RepID=UPI0019317F1E|nr:hypothetical protein [Robertkochia sediminum]MBL7473647.1 hypothetical protein [Robertkochia sediminum]